MFHVPIGLHQLRRLGRFNEAAVLLRDEVREAGHERTPVQRLDGVEENRSDLTPTSADQFYQATWHWLADPSEAAATRLSDLLRENLDTPTDSAALHARAWIALLNPGLRLASFEEKTDPDDIETLWRRWTRASLERGREERGAALERLQRHPRFEASDVDLGLICRELARESGVRGESGWRIDVDCGLLRRGRERPMVSRPLAVLIATLALKDRLSFDETLEICHGVSGYDPDLHHAKIHNLLVRARKLLGPRVRLRTRENWILRLGRPPTVRIVKARRPLRLEPAPTPRETPPGSVRRGVLSTLQRDSSWENRWFGREELERRLEWPKATLNRYLRRWIHQGWIERQGSGRKIVYRLRREASAHRD